MPWIDYMRANNTDFQRILKERYEVLDATLEEMVKDNGEIDRLLRFGRGLIAEREDGQGDRGDQGRDAAGKLDNEGLHGEDHALISSAVLKLTVVDCICKEDCRQDVQHAACRKYKEARNEQQEHIGHTCEREDQQHCVADHLHSQADKEDPDAGRELSKQRVEQHHGKDLDTAAEGREQGVGVVPACAAEIVLEEIDDQIGCDIHRGVYEDNSHNNGHGLIVLDEGAEHLPDRCRLHVNCRLLADIHAGEHDKDHEENRDDDRKILEADPLQHLGIIALFGKSCAECVHADHRDNRDNG